MNHLKPLKNMSIPCITHMLAFACATLLTACTYSTGSFDEPGLRGKLIDAETSQPVQGAVIYGYYATAEGSLGGGETIKEILRVFEVESNAEGVFEIPAWKTSWSITRGEPRQRFPAIAIYKDGYKLDLQNLSKIADWVSQTKLPGSGKRVGNVIDWTASPMQLKPTATERERYDALSNSNAAYADIGECGWEQHVKLLVAQHVAWKAFLKRNFPVVHLKSDGYSRGTYSHPDVRISSMQSDTSAVDKLIQVKAKTQKWTCADPQAVFFGEKK
jgi:hypothetical protein